MSDTHGQELYEDLVGRNVPADVAHSLTAKRITPVEWWRIQRTTEETEYDQHMAALFDAMEAWMSDAPG